MPNANKNNEALIVGAKIKELRLLKGLTQEQLSETIGIDNKRLSRIETGKSLPSLKIAKDLEKFFDFNFSELIADSNLDINIPPNKIFIQSVNILNSAKTDKERLCYLEALKHTQKCLEICNLPKSTENN